MLDRKLEARQLPWCRERGIAVLAYLPLEHGLLTGKLDPARVYAEGDLRRGNPKFAPENLRRVNALLEKFAPIARRHGASLGQIVVAWTVSQPGCTHALVGARNPRQAEENARAGDILLSPEELAEMAGHLAAAK